MEEAGDTGLQENPHLVAPCWYLKVSIYTMEIGQHYKYGGHFLSREPTAKSLPAHHYLYLYSTFSNSLHCSTCPTSAGGWGGQESDTHVTISKATTFSLLRRQFLSSIFPLSSVHYCTITHEVNFPMGIWLFITLERFFCTVICQAFIYSRQHLIELWKMAWTLNDKQMRRSDENHTCLKTMCFHMKYIWDF